MRRTFWNFRGPIRHSPSDCIRICRSLRPRLCGGLDSKCLARSEDALARRTRALFLNVKAATAMAPAVAELLARELGYDKAWQQQQLVRFEEVAKHFRLG